MQENNRKKLITETKEKRNVQNKERNVPLFS